MNLRSLRNIVKSILYITFSIIIQLKEAGMNEIQDFSFDNFCSILLYPDFFISTRESGFLRC
jgi:hypothetical protein